MIYEIRKKCDFSIYCHKFDTTIEENDAFSLEFKYASNSVLVKVLAEIVWLLPFIAVEFVFSMDLIYWRVNDMFHDNLLELYFGEFPILFYWHVSLRFSHLLSCIIKTLAIKKQLD